MNAKTSLFGILLLTFSAVIFFATQTSETEAYHISEDEADRRNLSSTCDSWSQCRPSLQRQQCGTGNKECGDSGSRLYTHNQPCFAECRNGEICRYDTSCGGTAFICPGDTVCNYGTCINEVCVEQCQTDDECDTRNGKYSVNCPGSYQGACVSCYRSKCQYRERISDDDSDDDSQSYVTPGYLTPSVRRTDGCIVYSPPPTYQPACNYCPRCNPRVNGSSSNCGATRSTKCFGGCTEWRGGEDCNNLDSHDRFVCPSVRYLPPNSRDHVECVCADRTKCRDSWYVNGSWNSKCRSGSGDVNRLSYDKQRVCFNGVWRNIHSDDSACSLALQAAGVSDLNKRVIAGKDHFGSLPYRTYNSNDSQNGHLVTGTRRHGSWICPIPPIIVKNRSCSEGVDCSSNTTGYQEILRRTCIDLPGRCYYANLNTSIANILNRHCPVCSLNNLNFSLNYSLHPINPNLSLSSLKLSNPNLSLNNLNLSASEDIAACDSASQCLFELRCYNNFNVDSFLSSYYRRARGSRQYASMEQYYRSYNRNVPFSILHSLMPIDPYYRSYNRWSSGAPDGVVEVDNGSPSLEYCKNGSWTKPAGSLIGFIRNTSGDHVQKNLTVTVLGTGLKNSSYYYTSTSSRLGIYRWPIDTNRRRTYSEYNIREIPVGTYDIIVEDPSGEYDTAIAKNITIPPFINKTQNILLKRSLGRDCNDDCTDHRGICTPKCHGKGECLFSSPEAMNICEGYFKGYADHRNDSKKRVLCCTGDVFTPVKAEITFCEGLENVAVVKKPVVFRGKFANMVVLAFDANECTNRKNNTE